jgi:ribosomal protein L34E
MTSTATTVSAQHGLGVALARECQAHRRRTSRNFGWLARRARVTPACWTRYGFHRRDNSNSRCHASRSNLHRVDSRPAVSCNKVSATALRSRSGCMASQKPHYCATLLNGSTEPYNGGRRFLRSVEPNYRWVKTGCTRPPTGECLFGSVCREARLLRTVAFERGLVGGSRASALLSVRTG